MRSTLQHTAFNPDYIQFVTDRFNRAMSANINGSSLANRGDTACTPLQVKFFSKLINNLNFESFIPVLHTKLEEIAGVLAEDKEFQEIFPIKRHDCIDKIRKSLPDVEISDESDFKEISDKSYLKNFFIAAFDFKRTSIIDSNGIEKKGIRRNAAVADETVGALTNWLEQKKKAGSLSSKQELALAIFSQATQLQTIIITIDKIKGLISQPSITEEELALQFDILLSNLDLLKKNLDQEVNCRQDGLVEENEKDTKKRIEALKSKINTELVGTGRTIFTGAGIWFFLWRGTLTKERLVQRAGRTRTPDAENWLILYDEINSPNCSSQKVKEIEKKVAGIEAGLKFGEKSKSILVRYRKPLIIAGALLAIGGFIALGVATCGISFAAAGGAAGGVAVAAGGTYFAVAGAAVGLTGGLATGVGVGAAVLGPGILYAVARTFVSAVKKIGKGCSNLINKIMNPVKKITATQSQPRSREAKTKNSVEKREVASHGNKVSPVYDSTEFRPWGPIPSDQNPEEPEGQFSTVADDRQNTAQGTNPKAPEVKKEAKIEPENKGENINTRQEEEDLPVWAPLFSAGGAVEELTDPQSPETSVRRYSVSVTSMPHALEEPYRMPQRRHSFSSTLRFFQDHPDARQFTSDSNSDLKEAPTRPRSASLNNFRQPNPGTSQLERSKSLNDLQEYARRNEQVIEDGSPRSGSPSKIKKR